MNTAFRSAALALVPMLLAACATPSASTGAATGAATASATSSAAGSASKPEPEFVLLGELHDNPDHHRARAEQLRRLIAQEPKTVVVFEQFSRGEDAAVAQARQARPGDVEAVIEAAKFDRKSWRWPLHQPLFEAALQSGAEVRGGNIDRDQVRKIVREGDAAWPADLLALRARVAWNGTQQDTLRKDIQDGHCGAMPEAMLPGMVQAQRARDAAMAQAMLDARQAGAKRVVLIAGNGHVRRDVAVPVYLQAAGVPASDIDAVAYLEPGSAAPFGGYDHVERAPAPSREDPCAQFKR
ncbi:ChaN family lipoprotein [Mitsuaria sp. GD03876]|uniref:ChaN family lipoprotein n=1 Tax=Mitsuaria sp. GD03876 TaxID=2975399 RepID=UPI00244853B8|nr:ChaN family lipoprotein [Mitsuaria sp. GD03876]MDH0863314.1 ChaN family lipoprotein [Mitsuaria sp. GD03876]